MNNQNFSTVSIKNATKNCNLFKFRNKNLSIINERTHEKDVL